MTSRGDGQCLDSRSMDGWAGMQRFAERPWFLWPPRKDRIGCQGESRGEYVSIFWTSAKSVRAEVSVDCKELGKASKRGIFRDFNQEKWRIIGEFMGIMIQISRSFPHVLDHGLRHLRCAVPTGTSATSKYVWRPMRWADNGRPSTAEEKKGHSKKIGQTTPPKNYSLCCEHVCFYRFWDISSPRPRTQNVRYFGPLIISENHLKQRDFRICGCLRVFAGVLLFFFIFSWVLRCFFSLVAWGAANISWPFSLSPKTWNQSPEIEDHSSIWCFG